MKNSKATLAFLGVAALGVLLIGAPSRVAAADEAPKHHKHKHKDAEAATAVEAAPAPEPAAAKEEAPPAAAAAAPQLPPYFSGTSPDPAKPLWPDPTGGA